MVINRSSSIDVLEFISTNGQSTPKYISDNIDLDASYVRLQLRELDEEGYVSRISDGLYAITEKGETAVEQGKLVKEAEL